jgi:hypothetical protein
MMNLKLVTCHIDRLDQSVGNIFVLYRLQTAIE